MKTVYLEELPYSPDSTGLYEKIRDLKNPVILDSSHPSSLKGRYDILSADPLEIISYSDYKSDSYDNILKYFRDIEVTHKSLFSDIQKPSEDIPFCGGAIGYLSYDLGRDLEALGDKHNHLLHSTPSSYFAFYPWCVFQDHLLKRCVFVALPQLETIRRKQLLEKLRQPHNNVQEPFKLLNKFQANLDSNRYREAFQKIQHYILEGDCYQVNLAQRFSAQFDGDPWQAYLKLRELAAAPFSAFLENDSCSILCLSPERFVSLSGRHVETKPIKGTRPRGKTLEADLLAQHELRSSVKDRAENLMIVDLLRNDLGKACIPGSIHVDKLFELESYPLVHHLVSTISGELSASISSINLLRLCFPGGSITGAPKHRAMQIIDELEPDARNIYCGSIAYISADGLMDSNIAIRTLLCEESNIYCWAGGGIVADSDWQLEYQETFDKIGQFLTALQDL